MPPSRHLTGDPRRLHRAGRARPIAALAGRDRCPTLEKPRKNHGNYMEIIWTLYGKIYPNHLNFIIIYRKIFVDIHGNLWKYLEIYGNTWCLNNRCQFGWRKWSISHLEQISGSNPWHNWQYWQARMPWNRKKQDLWYPCQSTPEK